MSKVRREQHKHNVFWQKVNKWVIKRNHKIDKLDPRWRQIMKAEDELVFKEETRGN